MYDYRSDNSITKKIFSLNKNLILWMVVLFTAGTAMLYSAAGGNFSPWASKQIIYFIIFFPIMIAIAITDINFWFKYSYWIYLGTLSLLLIVILAGHTSMGATRWIRIGFLSIQPSEVMKLSLVLGLAKYFYTREEEEIYKIRYLISPLIIIALPIFLIIKQPDLGTAVILGAIGITILFATGIKLWKFAFCGIAGIASIPFFWNLLLHDYQKKRILTFLNPSSDPLGAGYNIMQSKIAIGSGGAWGKGFLNGTQGQLEFLPEKQTDFIFTMLAEEMGFVGSLGIIALYIILIGFAITIGIKCKHQFGRTIAIGVASIIFFHTFINIGMVIGIVPVVGAPLPFLSYGGTFTATIFLCFGFLLNVDLYNKTEISIK